MRDKCNEGLNYSAHIIDLIPTYARNAIRTGMTEDAETIGAWRGMIQRSKKFVLPPFGEFFSQGRGLKEGIYPQRMPFPLISLEVPYPEVIDPKLGHACTKRHILCQEASLVESGGMFEIDNNPVDPQGFLVYIFSFIDSNKQWVPQPCAAYVRYDTPTLPAAATSFPGEVWQPTEYLSCFPFHRITALKQHWELSVLKRGIAEAEKAFCRDTATEIRVAFEFLQVLACRNVCEAEHLPPPALNTRRVKSGKQPFDKFYTLKIGDVTIGRPREPHELSDGYKVREHYRSGHIRRLEDRNVWVSDTIVALGSREGRVVKRYAVRAAA